MKFISERLQRKYNDYVNRYYKDHTEGEAVGFDEWYDNEYTCGYETCHDRTGKNKRPNEFYTKEFRCGGTSIARRDFEEMPCSMDTYDFTDEDMQLLAETVHANMMASCCGSYDLADTDIEAMWWSTVEGVAVSMGMNYYEDYDEDIVEY